MGPDTGQAAHVRPFADVISEVNKGVIADEAATELAKLVSAVKATGKKGRLTVTIEVAPFPGNDEIIKVSGAVAVRVPKTEPPTSIFYQDDDGNLTRDDPNVLPLFDRTEAHGATR